MRYLDLYDVLAIAARILRCESEEAVRRTDLDAVQRVLTDVRRTAGLAEASAVLLAGLVRGRPFSGANRVVAVAVVLQFTALNHADLRLEPVAEVDEVLDRIAAGDSSGVADFVRERLVLPDVTASLEEHLRLDLGLEEAIDEWMWRRVGMYERFTELARKVVTLAQEEARQLDHSYIGTEHVLLGLIGTAEGGASKLLAGASTTAVRELVVEIVGRGQRAPDGGIPFTPRAKATLEESYLEARRLGSENIDTEHLLLGLLKDTDGVAAQVLSRLGIEIDTVRSLTEQRIDRRQRSRTAVEAMVAGDPDWTAYGRRHHLVAELHAVLDENERLHEQVAKLRDLLRKNDIDPEG
ncbi:Clp protease N-terminal domain-containing protein [Kribbella sp. NPDC056345]|uniref:Clp protease N-terminal domain-containing protein n=1 Tax=Kribbella sp. NPDC056345 TaxID=3345789 RepID=UPI0035DA3FA5